MTVDKDSLVSRFTELKKRKEAAEREKAGIRARIEEAETRRNETLSKIEGLIGTRDPEEIDRIVAGRRRDLEQRLEELDSKLRGYEDAGLSGS